MTPRYPDRRWSARAWLPVIALCSSFSTGIWADSTEDLLSEAQDLLNQSDPAAAVRLLEPYEDVLAGDTRFDYLIGLAWMESGDPSNAIFALNRLVLADPDNAGARMELARAYFAQADWQSARREFLRLASQSPPPAARDAIQAHLNAMDQRNRRTQSKRVLYLLTAGGFDTNANVATDINDFLGFNLDDNSQETSSGFAVIGGGARYLRRLDSGVLLVASAHGDIRENPDASFVDSIAARGSFGAVRSDIANRRSLVARAYRLEVDGDLNSQGIGLEGEWVRQFTDPMQLGLFGRAGIVRYGDELDVKDVNQYLVGINGAWSLSLEGAGTVGGSLLVGRDEAVESDSRYSRDLYGGRVFLSWELTSNVTGYLNAGILESRYDEVFYTQSFDDERSDTLKDISFRLLWSVSPHWELAHSISFYDNQSEVDIFDYERLVTVLELRRVWD